MAMLPKAMTGSIWAFDYSSYGSISLLQSSGVEMPSTSREFHTYTEVSDSGQKTAAVVIATAESTAG